MKLRSSRSLRPGAAHADPRGAGIKVAVIAGVVMLALTALVFSSSYATNDLVEDGHAAQLSEASLGANDVAFKALGQLVLLAEDRLLGVADDAVVEQAAAEAQRALDELSGRLAEFAVVDPDAAEVMAAALAGVIGGADAVFIAVNGGGDPSAVLVQDAKPAFETLRDELAAERTVHTEALLSAGNIAGRMGNVSRFLVAFLLPLGAIVAYRYTARRQLRLAEVQLDAQLAAEHEVHKAKDEFIANMSHELRTPLTSIYGFSEVLIENGLLDPESAMDLIVMINGESAELGRMVEDLLVSARASADALSYSFQSVNLPEEVNAVIAPLTRSGSGVVVDLPDAAVWADPLRARQIIRNLVSNALRHGGERILLAGAADEDWVTVSVMDDGSGVPEEMVPRLFTRFVHDGEAALTVGSVGLGLAVVKELAVAMGGDVAYRREGEWTVFECWLPRTFEVAAAAVEALGPAAEAADEPGAADPPAFVASVDNAG